MCHLATVRYSCDHWDLFQLHCHKDHNELCEKKDIRIISRYWTKLQCLDCYDRAWYVALRTPCSSDQ